MTTVTTAEAAQSLPELLGRNESIVIRENGRDVAIIVSLAPGEPSAEARREAWDRLSEISKTASAQLAASLAADGITVEEFLADALADV